MKTTTSIQLVSKLCYSNHTQVRIFYHSDISGHKIFAATLNAQSKAQGFEKQLKIRCLSKLWVLKHF